MTRVLSDGRGRTRAVECFDANGVRHEISAALVVLAASVVQNPRLLLNLADARHPQGLANRSGQVGSGLMVDVIAPVYDLFDVASENHRGVNAGQLLCRGDQAADGMPAARLLYRHSLRTLRLREHLVSEGTRALKAAGAREVWAGPLAGGHLVGGTPMGADPASSVCDSYGRCHDVPNLILAGSGIFPGGSGTSPTFTIYALAERSAAYAVKHWSDMRA